MIPMFFFDFFLFQSDFVVFVAFVASGFGISGFCDCVFLLVFVAFGFLAFVSLHYAATMVQTNNFVTKNKNIAPNQKTKKNNWETAVAFSYQ